MALSIICDAVERYKELCEGAYAGMPAWHMPCPVLSSHHMIMAVQGRHGIFTSRNDYTTQLQQHQHI